MANPVCSICGIPYKSESEENTPCERCIRKRPIYDSLRGAFLYESGIMKAVHNLKYSGKTYIAKSLGPLLASFAQSWLINLNEPLIMPVPLHSRKLRQRGFNQSLLLANEVAAMMKIEIDFLSLRRTKNTKTQTGLKPDERQRNVKNAFELVGKRSYKARDIILADDVATTGSTVNECARILKKNGCSRVYGLVLARTQIY